MDKKQLIESANHWVAATNEMAVSKVEVNRGFDKKVMSMANAIEKLCDTELKSGNAKKSGQNFTVTIDRPNMTINYSAKEISGKANEIAKLLEKRYSDFEEVEINVNIPKDEIDVQFKDDLE